MAVEENALVVAPASIRKFFAEQYAVHGVDTPQQAYSGLADGTIPTDIETVIVAFGKNQVADGYDQMTDLVAMYSPDACVNIYVQNEAQKNSIRDKILDMVDRKGYAKAPFYFFTTSKPLQTVRDSKEQWDVWKTEQEEEETLRSQHKGVSFHKNKNPDCKIITVTSSKGGSGKSTTAILLASEIAMATKAAGDPKSVCAVDMNVFDGQLGFMVGQAEPTVISLLASSENNDDLDFAPEKIKKIAVTDKLKNPNQTLTGASVDYYLASTIGVFSLSTTDTFYRKLVLSLSHMYDYVIIDTSVEYITDNRLRNVAFSLADCICYMTTLAPQSLLGMTRWFMQVAGPIEKKGMGIPREKIGIIVNNAPVDVSKYIADVCTHANPEWDREKQSIAESGIHVIAAIPDAPTVVFNEAGKEFVLEKLLFDSKYGVGKVFYSLAKKVVSRGTSMRPIANFDDASRASAPQKRQQNVTQNPKDDDVDEAPKKKGGLFGFLKRK